jgi:hypothetical protein
MAQKGLCSVHLAPIYQKLDDDLLTAIGSSEQAQEFIKRAPGWDDAQMARRRKQLAWTLGAINPNTGKLDLEGSLQRHLGTLYKNVIKQDGSLKNMSPTELGFYTKLTQDVLTAGSAGIQDVAQKWLMKANEGQVALEEAGQLMRLIDGMTTMAGTYNQGAMELGRGLRQLGLNFDSFRSQAAFKDQFDVAASDVDDVAQFKNTFQEIADLFNGGDVQAGVERLQVVAQRVAAARDPMEVFKVTRSMKSLPSRLWDEVFITGLLWSPATAVTNAVGITWAFAKPAFQLMAAQTASTFGNSQTSRRVAAEASAKLTAMYQGFGDGWKLCYDSFMLEKSVYGKKTSFGRVGEWSPAITASNINAGMNSGIDKMRALTGRKYAPDGSVIPDSSLAMEGSVAEMIDKAGKLYRLPSRVMMGQDELVKHITMRGEAAAMGVRRAFQEGGIDDYFSDKTRFSSWVENEIGQAFNPDLSLNLAYEYAGRLQRQADLATFQESNVIAQGMDQILSVPVLGPALRPFFPFVRTPLNILKQGAFESTGLDALRRTIGGVTNGVLFSKPTEEIILKNLSDMADEAEGYRVIGQIAFTGTMIGFFYTGAMSGWITGGGPGRWENRSKKSDAQAVWLRQGNVPYTIRVPGTDTVVPFDRLGEPIAGVLRTVTDMAMFSAHATQEEQDAVMFGLANVAMTGLYQQTFLTGLRTLMDAFTNDTEDGVLKGRLVQNWLTAQTPAGGMINYMANVVSPYKAVYENGRVDDIWNAHEGGFGMLFAKIANRMPGRGNQPLLVDQVTGEPIPQIPGIGPMGLNAMQLAIPFFPRGVPKADETWEMIGKMTPVLRDKETPIQLTAPEQAELNRRMARATVGGKTYEQAIRDYYRQPEVQRYVNSLNGATPDSEMNVARKLRQIGKKYMEVALDQMMDNSDSLRMRYASYMDMKLAERANDQPLRQKLQGQLEALFDEARLRGVF